MKTRKKKNGVGFILKQFSLQKNASIFHKQLQRNGKQHDELNMEFWSRNTEIVFSCKKYINNHLGFF